ncbi:MAG: replication factor A [Theionarchaea archaeon]|nr:replication factor A [Theionarchaea archaeon]
MERREVLWEQLHKKGLSDAEIEQRIQQKLDEVGGLLTEEGALAIIANELGIVEEQEYLRIGDLVEGMSNVNVVGRVLGYTEPREFQRNDGSKGAVTNVILADKTGKTALTLWDHEVRMTERIQRGDILKIVDGITREGTRGVQIHLGRGKLILNPEDDPRIDEIPSLSRLSTRPSQRRSIAELEDGQKFCEIRATIAKLYAIRFYDACPDCFKRVEFKNNVFYCSNCKKKVDKRRIMIFEAGLDDCTGFIRASFFDKKAEDMLSIKTSEAYYKVKDLVNKGYDLRSAQRHYITSHHLSLLGQEILVSGDVSYNEYTGLTLNAREIKELDILEECYALLEGSA